MSGGRRSFSAKLHHRPGESLFSAPASARAFFCRSAYPCSLRSARADLVTGRRVFVFRPRLRAAVRSRAGALLCRNACPAESLLFRSCLRRSVRSRADALLSRYACPAESLLFRSCLRRSARSRAGALLSRNACPATEGGSDAAGIVLVVKCPIRSPPGLRQGRPAARAYARRPRRPVALATVRP